MHWELGNGAKGLVFAVVTEHDAGSPRPALLKNNPKKIYSYPRLFCDSNGGPMSKLRL